MIFSMPPIKEPLFISGTILSPVWVRWLNELFGLIQLNTLTTSIMQTDSGEKSTVEVGNTLFNFIPKAMDQSSNSPTESLGVDLVMALIPAGKEQSSNISTDPVNMQTLYWMGV